MTPRLQCALRMDTVAHAVTIRNSLVAQWSGPGVSEPASLLITADEQGQCALIGDGRFKTAHGAEIVRQWLQDQISNQPVIKMWIQAAQVRWHACTHDEPTPKSCRTTAYQEWRWP